MIQPTYLLADSSCYATSFSPSSKMLCTAVEQLMPKQVGNQVCLRQATLLAHLSNYIYTHFLCSLVKTFLVGLFFAPSPAAPGDNSLRLCPTPPVSADCVEWGNQRSPNRTAAHHRIRRSTACRSPVLTRAGICVPPTVTYLPYRVSGSTLTAVGRSQLLDRWPGTHSRILSHRLF